MVRIHLAATALEGERKNVGALPPGWYPDPDGSGMQRYFTGSERADYRHHSAVRYLSKDDRAALLSQVLSRHLAHHPDARVTNHTPHEAVVVYGSAPKHCVHALLTTSTCGLWLIGWLVLAAARRDYRVSFEVDSYGNIARSS
jgi:hypothetical protein